MKTSSNPAERAIRSRVYNLSPTTTRASGSKMLLIIINAGPLLSGSTGFGAGQLEMTSGGTGLISEKASIRIKKEPSKFDN